MAYVGFVGYTTFAMTFLAATYRPATVFLAISLIGLLSRPRNLLLPPFLKWYVVFVLWASFGSLGRMDPSASLEALTDSWKVLIVALAGVASLRSKKQLEVCLTVVLLAVMLIPLRLAVIDFFRGITLFGRMVGPYGPYQNPNDLASIALLLLGMAGWLSTEAATRISRLFGVCAMPLLVLIIVLTQSRGAFLGLSLMAAAMLLRSGPSRRRLLSVGAISVLVIAVVAPRGVMDRFSAMVDASSVDEMDAEGSAEQRFDILQIGLRMVASNPVFGVGFGMFNRGIGRIEPTLVGRDAHNTFLRIAAENGLPGLVFFLLMIGHPFWSSVRLRKRFGAHTKKEEPDWLLYGFGGFLVSGVFSSLGHIALTYIYLVFMWTSGQTRLREQRSGVRAATQR